MKKNLCSTTLLVLILTSGVSQCGAAWADDQLQVASAPAHILINDPAEALIPPAVDLNSALSQPDKAPASNSESSDDSQIAGDTSASPAQKAGAQSTDKPLEAGAKFPIVVQSHVSSKTAQVGDVVEATLSDDIYINGHLVAAKGSKVIGHVCTVQAARKVLKAELSKHRWMKSAGELGIQFDEIVNSEQEHLPLVAKPARQARFVKDMDEGRVLGINDKGEIVSPLSAQVKSQSIHLGIRAAVTAAGIAGGPIGLSVIPATFACLGAISPSFAFMHPVGKNMPHRRIKGFALGLISGMPGGVLVCDAIVRGPEAVVEPGDLFQAELKQQFSGEPSAVASTDPQPDFLGTVHGIIVPHSDKDVTQ